MTRSVSLKDASAFEHCSACNRKKWCASISSCEMRNGLSELDRAFLDKCQARHPRSAIVVTRRFFDGTEGKPFGSVPEDWDGTTFTYEFRMVP